jgi:hypothetical protein
VRELLRLVYDRLQEVPRTSWFDPGGPEGKVRRLTEVIEEVLADGIFDGCMTDIDMRQLPPPLR